MNRKQKIQDLYNSATPYWLHTWGDQMHHGYYEDPDAKVLDHKAAQILLIQELLKFANIDNATHVLDIGCGVGGTLAFLNLKFSCSGAGYNVSDVQVKKGMSKLFKNKIESVELICADATEANFIADSSVKRTYDLAIALESIEHMADKQVIFEKIKKALTSNGHLIVSSWFLVKDFSTMTLEDQKLILNIFNSWHIPNLSTANQYLEFLKKAGFSTPRFKDVTENVVPFWKGVVQSAFSWKSFTKIYTIRPSAIKGAWGVYKMYKAYEKGLLRYGFFVA